LSPLEDQWENAVRRLPWWAAFAIILALAMLTWAGALALADAVI
jgi:type VI protein secretion system component VasF